MSYNKTILIGRLGKDVELSKTSETPRARLILAVNDKKKTKSGFEEETSWFNCVAFDNLAENCAKFLSTGSLVLVEGKLKNRSFQDKQGVTKYVTEIIVSNVQFLETKKRESQTYAAPPVISDFKKESTDTLLLADFADDDIPF